MTQCSCPFQQRNQVLVLSLGQELGSLKQKSHYNSDFEWYNVLVPRQLAPYQSFHVALVVQFLPI